MKTTLLAIALAAIASCTTPTRGIPCTTSGNCPTGYLCDPLVGECYVPPAREAGRPDLSAERTDPTDAPQLDVRQLDVRQLDAPAPDTLPPDHLSPDAWPSCIAVCVSTNTCCGSTCPPVPAGCMGVSGCTLDSDCCYGKCISRVCVGPAGAPCFADSQCQSGSCPGGHSCSPAVGWGSCAP